MTEKSFYRSTTRPEIRRVARNYQQICWREIDKVFNSILKFSLSKTWKSLLNRIKVGRKMCLGEVLSKASTFNLIGKFSANYSRATSVICEKFSFFFPSRRSIKSIARSHVESFLGIFISLAPRLNFIFIVSTFACFLRSRFRSPKHSICVAERD